MNIDDIISKENRDWFMKQEDDVVLEMSPCLTKQLITAYEEAKAENKKLLTILLEHGVSIR